MTVLLNKWDGQRFENQHHCSQCLKFSAVKRICIEGHVRYYCKTCLLDMVAEIDQAVLEAACDMDRELSFEDKELRERKYGSPVF